MNTNTGRWLDMQGFDYMDADTKRRYAPLLRFTPAACTALVLTGLLLHSPALLAATAAIALFGSIYPSAHPLDLFYNAVLRHALRQPALPPNPAPRRFAAGIKAFPLFAVAGAMYVGNDAFAYGVGAFLAAVGTVAALTYWDLGSWLYRNAIERAGIRPHRA